MPMLFEYGRRVEGLRASVLEEASIPGVIYELNVKGELRDESKLTTENVKRLESELKNRFDAKLVYLGVDRDRLVMQVEGSPFTWSAFLGALPTLLQIIGFVLLGVSVVAIIKTIPWWQLVLFVLALMLIFGLAEKVVGVVKAVGEGGE